jgi:thioredoxin
MRILKFFATWCNPCKQLAPKLEAIASARGLTVEEINVDEDVELASRYEVMGVPTVLFVKGDKVVGKVVGNVPEQVLAEKVDKALAS